MLDLKRIDTYMDKVSRSQEEVFPASGKLKTGLDLGTAYIVLVVLDENNQPVACEKQAASVLRDGVVVDFSGARTIVQKLKDKLEQRIDRELTECAIAMPAGTDTSVRTHEYVAEGAGFEVTNVLDEPTAANSVYQIQDGVVVDIGGGTTGNYHVSFEEAEKIKQDYSRHKEIMPVVRPVVEKMATIVKKYIDPSKTDTIYLCGGTSCLTGIEGVFEKVTGIHTIKPSDPFLVTPAGIAMNCIVSG